MKVNSIAKRLVTGRCHAWRPPQSCCPAARHSRRDKEKDKNKVSKELAPSLKAAQEALQAKKDSGGDRQAEGSRRQPEEDPVRPAHHQ